MIDHSKALSMIRCFDTAIIRDMRATARELGIIKLLLEHQRQHHPDAWQDCAGFDLVEEALIILGVSDSELRQNIDRTDA